MSGPKDYSVFFDAARTALIAARRVEEMQRRNEALERRANENRERLQREMARLASKRENLTRNRDENNTRRSALPKGVASPPEVKNASLVNQRAKTLEEHSQKNKNRLAREQAKLDSIASEDAANQLLDTIASDVMPSQTHLPNNPVAFAGGTDVTDVSFKSELDVQLGESLVAALQWQEELNADTDVADFEKVAAELWTTRRLDLFKDAGLRNDKTYKMEVDTLVENAKEIHARAGERAVKFNTRNELLADIIASLKEIGFSVNDPKFENDADPGGVVVLVATRGRERMEASVDLSDEIRSTWDHVSGEHCKTAFFEYIDAMGKKGLEIKPHRDDLQSRPIQRQKGAKDLPRSQSDNV